MLENRGSEYRQVRVCVIWLCSAFKRCNRMLWPFNITVVVCVNRSYQNYSFHNKIMEFFRMLLLFAAVTSRTLMVGGAKLVRKERSVSGSYLIVMKSDTTAKQVDTFMGKLKKLSDNKHTPYEVSHVKGLYTISKGITGELNQDALELVQQSSLVDFIEEDGLVEGSAVGWHLDKLDQVSSHLDGIFAPGGTGRGVDIYVIDSGINMDHSEFESRAMYAGIDLVDEYLSTNNKGRDCNGHGTHVASLAAGKTAGVAKEAMMYSLRVLDCQKMGKQSSVLKALDYVTNAHMKNNRSTVIVMSLLGSKSLLLNSAVDHAVREGIVVVTAAGNNRKDSCNYSPGSSSSSINVGATDNSNFLYQLGQFGTNYGKCIDIFAPGVRVHGANYRYKNGFVSLSGTSMACPLVAGAAAILLQHFPTLSPNRIKDALIDTSTKNTINFSHFQPPLQGSTENRLLHINADTISSINRSLSETIYYKFVTEVSVPNVTNRAQPVSTDSTEKLEATKEGNHTNITTTNNSVNTTQSPSPTRQSATPVASRNQMKAHMKERSVQITAKKMFNRHYILHYMNYATTSNNNTCFTTIYKYDPKAEDYSVQCSLSYRHAQAIFSTVVLRNQIVYLLVPYTVNNEERYCIGLKRKKSGDPKVLYLIGLNPAIADQLYNIYRRFNYQLVGEKYVSIKDEVRTTLIYKHSPSAQQVRRYRDLSYDTLMRRIIEGQRNGYHIEDTSSYTVKGITYYSLLLTANFSEVRYKWSLKSRKRTKGTLKMYMKQGLYPLAIVSINLGYSEPYYLISLTSTT